MKPKEMLEHLKTIATPRTHTTLDAIYEVCREHSGSGATDFSFATIARIGNGQGVPKVQSIRNATGSNYRALILSFAQTVPAKQATYKGKSSEEWIHELHSPRHQLLVRILISELAEAKRVLKEIVPPGLEIYVDDRRESVNFKLLNVEKRALEYILSDDFMKKWNFRRGNKGDVVDHMGTRVFKPGTIEAIEKALKYL
jgi:hypothetical protein